MKYNILGFYQPRAVELGLNNNDLLILRWFVDYAGTNKMKTVIVDSKIYYWINYNTILEELPILQISKQTLYKKHFMNLVNAKVLEHQHIKENGSFSYYCYGINYDTLVYLEGGCVKNNDPMSKNTEGVRINLQTPMSKNNKQRLYNNINYNNNINNIEKLSKFKAPTYEEILLYAKEKNREDLSKPFFDYYTADSNNLWIDSSGKKVKNWKLKFVTWINKNPIIKAKDNNKEEFEKLFGETL